MRIEYSPSLSPFKVSSLFPGGDFRVSKTVAAFIISSFRRAGLYNSLGKCLVSLDETPSNTCCASLLPKVIIYSYYQNTVTLQALFFIYIWILSPFLMAVWTRFEFQCKSENIRKPKSIK